MGSLRERTAKLRGELTRDLGPWHSQLGTQNPSRMFLLGMTAGALVGAILVRTLDVDPWVFVPGAVTGGLMWLAEFRRDRRTNVSNRT